MLDKEKLAMIPWDQDPTEILGPAGDEADPTTGPVEVYIYYDKGWKLMIGAWSNATVSDEWLKSFFHQAEVTRDAMLLEKIRELGLDE